MEELDDIIHGATAAIGGLYFQLPIDGGDPVFRERVYCYELYHQLRVRWPDPCPYVLNGEVDKRAHPMLRLVNAEFTIPDLLIHTPGDMQRNHAIVEVKPANGQIAGIRKDLETLSLFRRQVGYQRAIYLFYGGIDLDRILGLAEAVPDLPPIEIWLHETHSTPAYQVALL